ncbi:MAG: RDD family protein [Campylobacteraceae bacterium]
MNNKKSKKKEKLENKNATKTPLSSSFASVPKRIKAFIIDMFMINMPILYITTYFILGSKEAFQNNPIAIFLCTLIFGIILSIFFAKSGQTPGFRAYEIKLIDIKTGSKPTFLRAFFRFFCFILSGFTLVGLFLVFFRKDGKNLQDILSKTIPVNS